MSIKTIKIKSTDEKTQGKYVLINECDFDKEIHTLLEKPKRETAAEKKAKLEQEVVKKV